jgi:hypothetical protein
LHGVFHLDKGILYTLKSLVLNPGYAVKGFISGKRVMHYNIFALFIIVVAVKTFIDYKIGDKNIFSSFENVDQKSDNTINEALNHYYKFFYLLSIPVLSIFTFLFSRKLKYNYTEHIVFNCFLLTGGLFFALFVSLFSFFTGIDTGMLGTIFVIAYLFWGYYQATRDTFYFFEYLWRILAIVISFILSLLLLLAVIIIIFYDGLFSGTIMF